MYYVYIITNFGKTVLYTGVTNNLAKRVWEHKNEVADGFTSKYSVKKLVYYENFSKLIALFEKVKFLLICW